MRTLQMKKGQCEFTNALRTPRRTKNLFMMLTRHSWSSHWKKGFTILELLVVISIISLIGSFIFIELNSAREKARDAEREGEIKTLQNALAIYGVNQKKYPVYSGPITGSDVVSQALINENTLSSGAGGVPHDPRETSLCTFSNLCASDYCYYYDSANGASYTLSYCLETDTITGKSKRNNPQTATP